MNNKRKRKKKKKEQPYTMGVCFPDGFSQSKTKVEKNHQTKRARNSPLCS
jgi:hypothetical protein